MPIRDVISAMRDVRKSCWRWIVGRLRWAVGWDLRYHKDDDRDGIPLLVSLLAFMVAQGIAMIFSERNSLYPGQPGRLVSLLMFGGVGIGIIACIVRVLNVSNSEDKETHAFNRATIRYGFLVLFLSTLCFASFLWAARRGLLPGQQVKEVILHAASVRTYTFRNDSVPLAIQKGDRGVVADVPLSWTAYPSILRIEFALLGDARRKWRMTKVAAIRQSDGAEVPLDDTDQRLGDFKRIDCPNLSGRDAYLLQVYLHSAANDADVNALCHELKENPDSVLSIRTYTND